MGGEGEVQVTSVESHGQLDAGWLAATSPYVPVKRGHVCYILVTID